MKEFIEKLIGRLEEESHWEESTFDEDGYCNDDAEEVIYLHRAIEIVNQLADEYEECFNLCSENCEVYDKEKHYCPKWCKVIRDTVAELKEDCNNDWIPCSSGWFSTSEVLVCKEDGTIDFDVYDFMDNDWKFNSNHHKNKVLAWKPLPAPYQPKGE